MNMKSLLITSAILLGIFGTSLGLSSLVIQYQHHKKNLVESEEVYTLLNERSRRIDILKHMVEELEKNTQRLMSLQAKYVTVTCYNSVKSQTDSTPLLTAINSKIGPGQVAVSSDLLSKNFTFGRTIWIEGFGVYVITDVMNKRFRNSIDIWVPKDSKIFKHENILAVLLEQF